MQSKASALLPASLLFLLFLFASCKTGINKAVQRNYVSEWKIVDSLEKRGLPKSAAEKVQALAVRARKDKNTPQMVKCLLYLGKYTATLEEDGFVKAIYSFENAEKTAKQPEKAVLQSILGECYNLYLVQNWWTLNSRIPLNAASNPRKTLGVDLLTADAAAIEQAALDYYAASLGDETLLRNIPLMNMGELVIRGQKDSIGGQPLRASLWEFLADRAIEHYSDEGRTTTPPFAFVLDQEAALAPAGEFVRSRFETRDSASGKWLTMRLYQRILAAVYQKADPTGYLHYDLSRLRYAYENAVLPDKKERFETTLRALYAQYRDHPAAGEILYRIHAEHVWSRDESEKGRLQNKAIVRELEDFVRRQPGTYGTSQCRTLLNRLQMKSLQVNTESVYLPDQPHLVSVEYRNVGRIYVRVVRGNFAPDFPDYISFEEKWDKLQKLPVVQERSWYIEDPGDCVEHRTEINLDPLPLGHYWVLVSSAPDFDRSKSFNSYSEFTVSNLAVLNYTEHNAASFITTDRRTGQPVSGVALHYFGQQSYAYQYINTGKSDQNGWVNPLDTQLRSFRTLATLDADSLWVGSYYRYLRDENPDTSRRVHFFTDRTLYRPGQTVWFKGILYRNAGKNPPVLLKNQSVTVKFVDANGKEKASLTLQSNEFGTFNGSFTAPSTGLTGRMYLRCENAAGSADFHVEEYKRPKFEVTMNPVAGEYRVGDRITATGEAKNYAGNAVNGAQVRYRVSRTAQYPFWSGGRSSYYGSAQQEISFGTTVTDATGGFNIEFEAIPDRNIPKTAQPVFDYEVSVDVTDVTGETRSSRLQISAGYVALKVDWNLDDDMEMDSLKRVSITTSNWSGAKAAAKGTIEVQKMTAPAQNYQKRYWEMPDLPVIPKADFEKLFPQYAWKDENNPQNWDKTGTPRILSFNTSESQTLNLHEGQMTPGFYLIRLLTEDKYGEKIELRRIIHVTDSKKPASKLTEPNLFVDKTQYAPGDTAQITFDGKTASQSFFFAIERNGQLEKRWVTADPLHTLRIPITAADQGGLVIHTFAVRDNRIYAHKTTTLLVPWEKEKLNIRFETFRDQLQPGSEEEWRIHISGAQKEKVAAEMVAALYDASLDQFLPHDWGKIGFPKVAARININDNGFVQDYGEWSGPERENEYIERRFPTLNWFDFLTESIYESRTDTVVTFDPETYEEKVQIVRNDLNLKKPGIELQQQMMDYDGVSPVMYVPPTVSKDPPAPRRNLQETVFFFPELRTDAEGNLILKFRMNEAPSRWKLLMYAHTQELQQAVATKTLATQKELMVQTNVPRFLRSGDRMLLSAKVTNLSQKTIAGNAMLRLLDAQTMQPVGQAFAVSGAAQPFEVLPGQSVPLGWPLQIPADFAGAVTWQVFADGGTFRDGEENTVPVVTQRMLITETLPMVVRGNQTGVFEFENLKNATESNHSTLKTHRFTLEMAGNPVWYAVQTLPYLMEYPFECNEQIFSRFYANALAADITQKLPQIRRVYDRWKGMSGSDPLASNLAKNQELKYALLEETPWVLEARDEESQKRQIALLFDLNQMADAQERALNTLTERQAANGGFSWFPGGEPNWFVTQHIYSGLGHLARLGVLDLKKDQTAAGLYEKCAAYCVSEVEKSYRELEMQVQKGKTTFEKDHLNSLIIQYLYAATLVQDSKPKSDPKTGAYYLGQLEKYWLGKGLYLEGLAALALHRAGRTEAAKKIAASLRERATIHPTLGMYWPHDGGYLWYQMPIETQALMVEVFSEVAKDRQAVEDLRIWLLQHKQTNRWETTKTTTEAVYALLLGAGDTQKTTQLNNQKPVQITLGEMPLNSVETEPGTGYFKQSWSGSEVQPSWSNIAVENPNTNLVWGAAYWQYFEDLDKAKTAPNNPLSLKKALFRTENTAKGPVLTPVTEGTALKRGDQLRVRLEIRADRDMEFVHLKDMRAAGFEPINVISRYRWQGNLGYYESTKDLATHFFFDHLPRGTYVFEYPLVVAHPGDMSNGVATIQCMYAPAFTNHSAGTRVRVE